MDFILADWATVAKLTQKTVETLEHGECTDEETLCLLNGEDVARLDISLGQRKRLLAALSTLRTKQAEPTMDGADVTGIAAGTPGNTDGPPGGDGAPDGNAGIVAGEDIARQAAQLMRAGQLLDGGRRGNGSSNITTSVASNHSYATGIAPPVVSHTPPPSSNLGNISVYDPCSILYLKSTKCKAVHVIEHIPEEVKLRIKRKKADKMVLATSATGELTVKNADETVSYAGLSVDEWSAANIRVMYCLIDEGRLTRAQIDTYLAYTVLIMELVRAYEWHSILAFDARYREMQARLNCTWGTMGEQLRCQTLVVRVRPTGNDSGSGKSTKDSKKKKGFFKSGDREKSSETCRQWALGQCRFGDDKCRYSHTVNASKN